MGLNQHQYQAPNDLRRIGGLIRRAYQIAPNRNVWSIARCDIWAQRCIAAEQVHGETAWQQDVCLWEDDDGELLGAGLFPSAKMPALAALIVDPDQPVITSAMLMWAEAQFAQNGFPAEFLQLEVMESNVSLERRLRARGYTRSADYMNVRHKTLDPAVREPVVLPPGYTLKSIESVEEWLNFHQAVHAVFNMLDSLEVYRVVQQAPSYVPELNLIVFSEAGEVVSFCSVWHDPRTNTAEFEPIGTLPAYQKRGLGLALLAEGCNRLRARGCPVVRVDSWNESPGANRLYESAGFATRDRIFNWSNSLSRGEREK